MDLEKNPARGKTAFDYRASPVLRPEHVEGSFTRLIEQQTAKIPSHYFLIAALGSMGTSLVARSRGNRRVSDFVGLWVAPLLIMGVYNKLVKLMGPS